MSRLKSWGFLAALVTVFAAGTKTGLKYAKNHYVAKDRKFIEGEIIDKKKAS